METKPNPKIRSRAFSLIELLTVVAAVAVIGSLAVVVINDASSSVKETKLEQEVTSLNTAIEVFLSSGGSLSDIDTAQGVLTELKRAAANEMQVVGVRGSVVDVRLQAVEERNGELRERAIWMADLGKFVLAESDSGVREFVLNDELAKVDYSNVARNTSLIYNDADGWVWETHEFNLVTNTGPTSVVTTNAPTLGAGGTSGSANGSRLNPPIISPGAGSLPLAAFPLQVTISKHSADPVDTSIYYSTQSGTWVLYTGPFTVDPGAQIQAYSSHEDPEIGESDRSGAYYLNDIEELSLAITVPKNPITYAEAGGALEEGDYTPLEPLAPITVSLGNGDQIPARYQDSSNFQVYWTYDGSDPLSSPERQDSGSFSGGYSGAIDYTLPRWDGATLLPVKVVALSNNASVVKNSAVNAATIDVNRTDPAFTRGRVRQ